MTDKVHFYSDAKIDELLRKIGRLPCRGCTSGCSNYTRCNGQLWRMDQEMPKQKGDGGN